MTSWQRRATTTEDGQTLLTTAEAAALLQPHMGRKNALAWLLSDRRHDPLIPFLTAGGAVRYRSGDVIGFILRHLDPSARFAKAGRHLIAERRLLSSRRSGRDRRSTGRVRETEVERRVSGDLDRRLRGDLDRRARP